MPGPLIVAAGRPADLKIVLEGYDQAKHEAHLKVTNTGDDAAPPTTLQVRTFAPGAGGNPVSVSVPALKASAAFQYAYKVDCVAGVHIQAQDTLTDDPTPDNNTLNVDPCHPDLTLSFQGRRSDQDLQFRISNVGGIAAPATSAHFETETTPPSNPVDVKLPPLGPGQSKTVDYVMNAPCPGLAVKGVVPMYGDADPAAVSTLQLFACDPDLTIKYQGFLPNSDHDMSFMVTNVGGATSPATTVQIATVKPAPPSNQRAESIPALDPGASYTFSYSLASTCDGNDVKATIALDSDPNQANLSIQVTACDPISPDQKLPAPGARNVVVPPPPPPDTRIQRGGSTDISRDVALATPDYLQPGDHEMDLTPTMVQDRQRETTHTSILPNCFAGAPTADPGSTFVGWAQGLSNDCETLVSQTAVRFDISPLLQGGPKLITSALLSMDEKAWKWTDGDGGFRTVAGCVAAIGLASTDFVADPPTGNNLYSNDTYVDVTPGAATQFDVKVPVEDWFSPDSPRYGFVLKGSVENPQNDDQSSCMSEISNVQLVIDYTVL
jgi:hypothetical protein